MSGRQNVMYTKNPEDKFFGQKFHVDKMSFIQNVRYRKCHVDKMSCRQNVMQTKCYVDKMLCRQNFSWTKC